MLPLSQNSLITSCLTQNSVQRFCQACRTLHELAPGYLCPPLCHLLPCSTLTRQLAPPHPASHSSTPWPLPPSSLWLTLFQAMILLGPILPSGICQKFSLLPGFLWPPFVKKHAPCPLHTHTHTHTHVNTHTREYTHACTHHSIDLFLPLYFFNWRIIALQKFVVFCQRISRSTL